jgi:hypothetical protein
MNLNFTLDGSMYLFLAEAIVDIYHARSYATNDMISLLIRYFEDARDIFNFEYVLSSELKLVFKDIGKILVKADSWQDIRWSCKVTFDADNPVNERCHIEFLPPSIEKSSNFYVESIGSQRLLNVTFSGLTSFMTENWEQNWAAMKIFNNGILFAEQKYHFLGGEIPHKKITEERKYTSALMWFACECMNSQYEDSRVLSIDKIRNYFGKLYHLPSSKCNSRVKLGFSPLCLLPRDITIHVELIADVISPSGAVMTDGCGYISTTLAKYIPYDIQSGTYNISREESWPSPAVIQVRIVIGSKYPESVQGLYKGCLIFTDDEILCKSNSIVLRHSMRKSGPNPQTEDIRVGVLKTFEHRDLLKNLSCPTFSDFKARLNRQLCLLLKHLGVHESWFKQLATAEINCLKASLDDPEAALKLTEDLSYCDIDESDDPIEDGEIDFDKALSIISIDPLANEVKESLIQKQNLAEPYLRHQLQTLIRVKYEKRLRKCLFEVKSAIYLVGAPDPYEVLEPNEVFIGFPNDRKVIGNVSMISAGFEGKVVVCKHPLNHPGDIQVFTAVKKLLLTLLNQKTNSGVIYFSIKGDRSPADMMSGSDYDGDQFLIFYGQNEIVSNIKSVSPFTDNPSDAKVPGTKESSHRGCSSMNCRECHIDRFGVSMFLGLMSSSQLQYINRYSNAWLEWANIDVNCQQALDCAALIRVALDAAKTGKVVPHRHDLLINFFAMKNMRAAASSSDNNQTVSILDQISKLFDENRLHLPSDLTIDFDFLMVVEANDNPILERKCNIVSLDSWDNEGLDVYQLFPDWKDELDYWISEVQRFSMSTRKIMQSRQSTSSKMNKLTLEYAKDFNERVEYVSHAKNLGKLVTKCRLASIVYLASYFEAYQTQQTQRRKGITEYSAPWYILGFCWKICGDALNMNKHIASQARAGRAVLKIS